MAFGIDPSQLTSAADRLAVIGNNITNSGVSGFQGQDFSSVLASSSLSRGGTTLAGGRQLFTQGTIQKSANNLDMAINGNGFFRLLRQDNTIGYTRDGAFSLDKNGHVTSPTGDYLTGYGINADGTIAAGAAVPLVISTADSPALPTKNAITNLMLDARSQTLYKTVAPTADLPNGNNVGSEAIKSYMSSSGGPNFATGDYTGITSLAASQTSTSYATNSTALANITSKAKDVLFGIGHSFASGTQFPTTVSGILGTTTYSGNGNGVTTGYVDPALTTAVSNATTQAALVSNATTQATLANAQSALNTAQTKANNAINSMIANLDTYTQAQQFQYTNPNAFAAQLISGLDQNSLSNPLISTQYNQGVQYTFDPTNGNTYNNSTTATVYDAQGKTHELQMFYVKEPDVINQVTSSLASATVNEWKVYVTVDGVPTDSNGNPLPNIAPAGSSPKYNASDIANGNVATMFFNSSGNLAVDASGVARTSLSGSLTTNVAIGANTVKIDLSNTRQYASDFLASVSQDGFPTGSFQNIKTDTNGVMTANYSSGETKVVGQTILAIFKSPTNLTIDRNNQFDASAASGAEILTIPGTGGAGQVLGSSTEAAGVDLTNQMIALISAQRSYQANSEVVKRQDQILQTIIGIGQ